MAAERARDRNGGPRRPPGGLACGSDKSRRARRTGPLRRPRVPPPPSANRRPRRRRRRDRRARRPRASRAGAGRRWPSRRASDRTRTVDPLRRLCAAAWRAAVATERTRRQQSRPRAHRRRRVLRAPRSCLQTGRRRQRRRGTATTTTATLRRRRAAPVAAPRGSRSARPADAPDVGVWSESELSAFCVDGHCFLLQVKRVMRRVCMR